MQSSLAKCFEKTHENLSNEKQKNKAETKFFESIESPIILLFLNSISCFNVGKKLGNSNKS